MLFVDERSLSAAAANYRRCRDAANASPGLLRPSADYCTGTKRRVPNGHNTGNLRLRIFSTKLSAMADVNRTDPAYKSAWLEGRQTS